jgi:hypothetical protein
MTTTETPVDAAELVTITRRPTNVIEAIAAVKAEVGAVGKNRTMNATRDEGGGYAFRSIEDVYNACHGPMAANCLVIVPHEVVANERRHFEYEKKTRQGEVYGITRGVEVVLHIRGRAYGPGGLNDYIEFEVVGEAKDYSDKASNKAHTMADKIAVTQLLKIPYSDMADQDDERPEEVVGARRDASADEPQDFPVGDGWIMGQLMERWNDKDAVRAAFDAWAANTDRQSPDGMRYLKSQADSFLAQQAAAAPAPAAPAANGASAPAPAPAPPTGATDEAAPDDIITDEAWKTFLDETAKLTPEQQAALKSWANTNDIPITRRRITLTGWQKVMKEARNFQRGSGTAGRQPAQEPPSAPAAPADTEPSAADAARARGADRAAAVARMEALPVESAGVLAASMTNAGIDGADWRAQVANVPNDPEWNEWLDGIVEECEAAASEPF